MAESLPKQEEAEDYIRRASKRAVIYARIPLHGTQNGWSTHETRKLGASIQILEHLIHRIRRIKQARDAASVAKPAAGRSGTPKVEFEEDF